MHASPYLARLALLLAATSLYSQEPTIVLREDLEQNPELQLDYQACDVAAVATKTKSRKQVVFEECPVSRLYLMSSSSEIALAVTNRLYGVITLPHFLPGKTTSFNVDVTLVTPTAARPGRFSRPYVAVDISSRVFEALVDYLKSLPVGGRYEPVLEIKNLIVGGEETTTVNVVPVGLTLAYDSSSSVFLNGEVSMRAIYVPYWMDPEIEEGRSWTANQGSPPTSLTVCGAAFANNHTSRKGNSLTIALQGLKPEGLGALHFAPPPRRSNSPSPNAKSAPSTPPPPRAQSKIAERREVPIPVEEQFTPAVPFTPIPPVSRPLSFRFGAPVVATDYPVYFRGEFASSDDASNGRSNIVGIDFNLNFNDDKNAPGPLKPIAIAGNPRLTISPSLKLKMNNILNVDNENSLRWWLPLAWTRPFDPQCVSTSTPPCPPGNGALCCSKPFLRSISLVAGFNGEHSAYNQNQNLVVPFGGTFRFRKFNAAVRKDYDISLDVSADAQLGRTIDQSSVAYITTADTNRSITFRPPTATNIRRLHGQVKLSIGLGKNRAFNFNWDRWQLLEPEQYLRAREIRGSFSAPRPEFLPADIPWEPINQKLSFFLPEYRKGFRHYWLAKFVWELSPHISFDASYFRGELPPAFQFVDKFTIGIAFQKK